MAGACWFSSPWSVPSDDQMDRADAAFNFEQFFDAARQVLAPRAGERRQLHIGVGRRTSARSSMITACAAPNFRRFGNANLARI
jgi:hypothetical protein